MLVNSYTTIQAAIGDGTTLDNYFVTVDAGTYNENVTINKNGITLTGLGAGATITGGGADGINLIADDVTIDNFTVTGFNDGLELGSSDGVTLLNCSFDNNNINNLKVSNAAEVINLTVTDCSFDDAQFGWYISNSTSGGTNTFDGITVTGTSFSGNTKKGIYAEKMSNASFDQITVDASGTDVNYNFNNGVDINLKWDDYSNISFTNSAFTNSGVAGPASNVESPAAVTIKARDDAPSYDSPAATLDGVIFTNNIVTGPENGLRFGEFGKTNDGPTNVVVNENDFSHSFAQQAFIYNVVNVTAADLNADCNWWGSTVPADIDNKITGSVTFEPFIDNGTDDDPALTGFQPVANSCTGGPVNVYNTTPFDITSFVSSHSTIQAAIDAATTLSGYFVVADAGTYNESVYIYKDNITLLGPNVGKAGDDGTRVAEAIVVPTAFYGIYTDAAGVTIDGITLDGDGADIGIYHYTEVGNGGLTVQNNIVKEFADFGLIGWVQTGPVSSNNLVTNNLFFDMESRAITALWNYYANMTDNVIYNTAVGLYAENANQPEATGTVEWKDNTISASRAGIWYNLVYGTATPLTIKDNTINVEDNAVGTRWDGVWLTSLGGSVDPIISNNDITGGTVTQQTNGYNLWNNNTTATGGITIDGGSVSDVGYGVWINNFEGFPTTTGSDANSTTCYLAKYDHR